MIRDIHFWITAQSSSGRTILIYGGPTEVEATNKAMSIKDLPSYFDVIPLPTRNMSRASQLLKGRKLEESGSLEGSTQDLQHTMERRQYGRINPDSPDSP